MADEARAMLDALMGADRNASLAEKGISATSGRRGNNRKRGNHHGHGSDGGSSKNGGGGFEQDAMFHPRKKLKRSCYDEDICPYYTSWGVDVYDLFTNTKSDMGPNPCVVDADARAEFNALNEDEQEVLGYERMLQRKLRDMVRRVDWTVTRNKQKLRQEIESKKSEGRVHVDPLHLTNVDRDKLERAAQLQAQKELVEEEISEWLERLDDLERKELEVSSDNIVETKDLRNQEESKTESNDKKDSEPELERKIVDGTTNSDSDHTDPSDPKRSNEENPIDETGDKNEDSASQDIKHDDKQPESGSVDPEKKPNAEPNEVENSAVKVKGEFSETADEEEDAKDSEKNSSPSEEEVAAKKKEEEIRKAEERLEEQLKLQREEQGKVQLLDTIFSKMEQLAAMSDDIQQSLKSLRYFRGDTAADKVVCEISGNFMSARDAEERIAAHYAGKQYQGWKIVRDKLKELDQKFRNKPPPRRPALLPHEREAYKRDKDHGSRRENDTALRRQDNGRSSSRGRSGERGDSRYHQRGRSSGGSSHSPEWDRHHHRRGGSSYRGDDGDRYYDRGGRSSGSSRDGGYHYSDHYRGGGGDGRRYDERGRGGRAYYDEYPQQNSERRYRDDRRDGGRRR